MKIEEIKEKIENCLRTITIDDYYSDPSLQIVKDEFSKLTGLSDKHQVREYLAAQYPATSLEKQKAGIKKDIHDLELKTKDFEKDTKQLKKKIESLTNDLQNLEAKLGEIPPKVKTMQSELLELEGEENQIKPLAGKSPYDAQIKNLERYKGEKQKAIELLKSSNDKINAEIQNTKGSIDAEKNRLNDIATQIEKTQKAIQAKNIDLKAVEEKENTSKAVFNSLQFLFNTVLQLQVAVTRDSSYTESYLDVWKLKEHELKQIVSPFFNDEPFVIPKDWRKAVYKSLNNLSCFDGMLNKPYTRAGYFSEKRPFESTDISFLLALRRACKYESSIRIGEKVVLAMSGGTSVTISFRKKSAVVQKVHDSKSKIFAKLDGEKQYIHPALYYQTGYADSQIRIQIPVGYVLFSEDCIIDLHFDVAPVLIGNPASFNFPNISAKAKEEDKIEAAEERRRQDEEDDYWYDNED